MGSTAISWTDKVWNPTTGCSHVSDGCSNCYAELISLRRGWSKHPWTANHAKENVVLHPDRLRRPYSWKKPCRVFVNSMSDLFHPEVPDSFVAEVFEVMAALPRHTFQVLTKRPERMAQWPGPWTSNIWAGTSIEDGRVVNRADWLRQVPAQVRFISAEPLLGPLPNLDLRGVHWVVIGGESGLHLRQPENRHRWMKDEWARQVRDLAVEAGASVFYKQGSGLRSETGTALREADGSRWLWRQWPDELTPPQRVTP